MVDLSLCRFRVADDSGSPVSLAAVGRFLADAKRDAVVIDLLNVQVPVHRDVANFVAEDAVKDLHHEEGMKALEPARALIERAGVPCTVHIGVGDFAHVVAHYANTLGATQVYVTETERAEGSDLSEAVAAMAEHTRVPVAVVR